MVEWIHQNSQVGLWIERLGTYTGYLVAFDNEEPVHIKNVRQLSELLYVKTSGRITIIVQSRHPDPKVRQEELDKKAEQHGYRKNQRR